MKLNAQANDTMESKDWERKRLKHLGKIYPGLAGKAGDDFSRDHVEGFKPFVPFVSIANFSEVPKAYQYVRVRDFEPQNKVRAGDLLFLMSSETLEDIGKSSIFEHEGELPYLNSFCKGFRANAQRIFPKFLNYTLMSAEFREYFANVARGFTRINLKQEYILNAKVCIPPLPEQRAIAAFLDGKCATIDEAVRIKEAQIRLLRERRQVLIQQAVTRGLNPDAPMKDSRIDWIGQIPAHWEVRRNKHHFREVNERSDEGNEELLSVSHTTGVTARSEKNVNMFLAEDYTGSKLCQPGDVVINTMWAWMGALGVSDLKGIISPSYGVYRPLQKNAFNRRFLEWLLRTTPLIEQYNKISTGLHSSRLRLYPHMFLGLPMAFPSRDEQDAIVTQVENESGKIDNAVSIKQDQIAALKDYKTGLINAAVTGKIKVISSSAPEVGTGSGNKPSDKD